MLISIIIPNYNGEELLKKNLPKVIEATEYFKSKTDSFVEIIIVDDGSTDNSIEVIKNDSSKFKIIKNDKNLGFASSINRGVSEAYGEIVVLLNTDVSPEKEFLIPLVKHLSNKNIFAVGCMDKSIENGKTVLRGRGLGKWEKGFLVHRRGEVNKTNTLWVSGGSGAFSRSVWNKIGGFNELYHPFYWEDIDLSYRALKSGFKLIFEPKSIVLHEHESGVIKKKYSPFQIKTVSYKNQFIFVWVNATDLNLQLLHIFWLPYHLVRALTKRDFALILGFFQAFVLLPKAIQTSFRFQKLFVKTDKEVIEEFHND